MPYPQVMAVQHSSKALLKISGLLTATEAAKRAGVDPGTIVTWIRYGFLPATRLGHWWVIDEGELTHYLEQRGRSHE